MNPKHQQFINEYLACWNQTEAYRRVYPNSGYDAARANAARLIANDSIAAAIETAVADRCMTKSEVLIRLAEQARSEQSAYIEENGSVNMSKLVRAGKAHLIKGIKETKYGTDIEFYDAQSALEKIGRHHKLFTDRQEITGTEENDGQIPIMLVAPGLLDKLKP